MKNEHFNPYHKLKFISYCEYFSLYEKFKGEGFVATLLNVQYLQHGESVLFLYSCETVC